MHDKNTRLYYWYPSENWPPKSVQEPGEIRTDGRLSVSCTQTSRSANDQRKLVARWCDTLPNLRGVRHLWLCSRVPQRLFDAACQVPGLESLYIKWGGIKKLNACEDLLNSQSRSFYSKRNHGAPLHFFKQKCRTPA